MNPKVHKQLKVEIAVVLLISLGQSAIYSVLRIVDRMTRPEPIGQQISRINTSTVPDRPWLDLLYQVVNTIFPLVPAALVLYLLWVFLPPPRGPLREMGFDFCNFPKDLLWGFSAFLLVGLLGLAWYIVAVNIGINTVVVPANLAATWWSVPILICRAGMNGIVEEVVMIGYLFTRWSQRGGNMMVIVIFSAVVRGGYHLYQGWGGFVGNVVMGIAFGLLYLKLKRVMPLVIIHTLLDLVSFLGAGLLVYLPFAPK